MPPAMPPPAPRESTMVTRASRRRFTALGLAMLAAGSGWRTGASATTTSGAGGAGGTAPGGAAAVPAAVAAEIAGARLAGEGDMRWFGLRVYTAQLWVGAAGLDPQRLDARPFALQLRYAMSLSGSAIARRSMEEIERLGLGDARRRDRWLAAMIQLFPDVGRDDRLIGIHRPGRGATFHWGDRALGNVEEPEFSTAFFSIWLDERTVAPDLRRQLLQRAAA
jgi:hypothetical protein